MKLSKKKVSCIILVLFVLLFLGTNIVYAATSSDLHFCEYPGTLRALKTIGIIIGIIKVAVPVLIIITSMITFVKVIISGKEEDFRESAKTVVKKVIAGILIFLIPDIIDFVFNNVVDTTNSSNFKACETCLTKVNSCTIPDTNPSIYTD